MPNRTISPGFPFTPAELAVLEAFVPRILEDDGAFICVDDGEHAMGQGSTVALAQESWLNNLAERLVLAIDKRRRERGEAA